MTSNGAPLVPENGTPENVSCCGPTATPSEGGASAAVAEPAEVLVISDSCCNPSAASAEEEAVRTVDAAIAAVGSSARSRLVSATDALAGALPQEILTEIQSQLARGSARPPMVMIDGQIVASGTFTRQEVETALTGANPTGA
ncbi:hypothetical protein [Streptomyces gobiensis]|uniref:hypothetical protein n=1 Tax=Streptomyces gobiensis TaxID=2875706 RepID=UPI001E421355|nr:hypothetical protein [Streptomyces gobiensis]UGY91639.1 hypothetical protein test1122_07820 [Streptomyces gobiensis]